jgi:hypothetical protein
MDADLILSTIDRGKQCLIFDGYTFRLDRVMKDSNISWRCTNNKTNCKARISLNSWSSFLIIFEGLAEISPEAFLLAAVRNYFASIFRSQASWLCSFTEFNTLLHQHLCGFWLCNLKCTEPCEKCSLELSVHEICVI